MSELSPTHRARLESAIELVTEIARGNFEARGTFSARRDEIDALVVALNVVAEDFGIERARRVEAERELRDRVEAYESAAAMFCSVDPATGSILDCNATMERALGRPRASLVGLDLAALYTPESVELARASLRALQRGEPLPPGDHGLLAADGRVLPALLSVSAGRARGGEIERLRLIYRDVSSERRLEGQLVHAQRMDELGRLAGGVAHDFNNLLTGMILSAESLVAHVAPAGADDLKEVLGAAHRAAALVSQLLAFSRRDVVVPRAIDPNERTRAMDALLARTLGERISIRSDLHPDPWTVRIDPARFDQVLMNLAVNARDAMPGGGEIVLCTRNVTLDVSAARRLPGLHPGEHLELSITDHGVGIAPDVLDRIFEPFFTTKGVGLGTGLGLATTWGIVQQAGGAIAVESELGVGTTFRVYLPRWMAPVDQLPAPPRPAGGHETVLVVEDDPLVRRVMVRALTHAGYRVIESTDGVAAQAALASSGPVDLVISDLVMPRLGGRALARQLRAEGLCRAVLLVSGYAGDDHGEVAENEGAAFLPKPFTPPVLLAAVRSLLDRR